MVIPNPSIFLPEDSEINMPIVSVNIRDTAAPNNTEDDSMSFVTTLSNVNNDPPKQDIRYCVNTTELYTLNFAYQVGSRESAFRFDLIYPTMNIFFKVSLRLVDYSSININLLHAHVSLLRVNWDQCWLYRLSSWSVFSEGDLLQHVQFSSRRLP